MVIDEFLKIAIERDASDLHFKAGNNPMIRVHGTLTPLTGFPRLTAPDCEELANQLMTEFQRKRLQEDLDIDLAYSLPGFGRFRGSIYHQRGSLAIALRITPLEVKKYFLNTAQEFSTVCVNVHSIYFTNFGRHKHHFHYDLLGLPCQFFSILI